MRKVMIALALVLGLAFSVTSSVYGTTILVVSDAYAPGDEPTKEHNDDSMVLFLQDLGYSVDTSGMGKVMRGDWSGKPAIVAAVEAADLIIVSRRTSSGDYGGDDTKRKLWNTTETPILSQSGYLTRDSRWGWTTGGSGNVANKDTTDCDFAGVVSELLPNTMFDWSDAPSPGESPKGPYLPNVVGETVAGDVLATFDGRLFLVDIASGTDLDAMNGTTDKYGVTGGRRVFMGVWGYDDGTAGTNGPAGGPAGWGDYMTTQYKGLFAEVVHEVPEPATIALLGFGGLAMLRIRKKR